MKGDSLQPILHGDRFESEARRWQKATWSKVAASPGRQLEVITIRQRPIIVNWRQELRKGFVHAATCPFVENCAQFGPKIKSGWRGDSKRRRLGYPRPGSQRSGCTLRPLIFFRSLPFFVPFLSFLFSCPSPSISLHGCDRRRTSHR